MISSVTQGVEPPLLKQSSFWGVVPLVLKIGCIDTFQCSALSITSPICVVKLLSLSSHYISERLGMVVASTAPFDIVCREPPLLKSLEITPV